MPRRSPVPLVRARFYGGPLNGRTETVRLSRTYTSFDADGNRVVYDREGGPIQTGVFQYLARRELVRGRTVSASNNAEWTWATVTEPIIRSTGA